MSELHVTEGTNSARAANGPVRLSKAERWSVLVLLVGLLASAGLAGWQHRHEQTERSRMLERGFERTSDALESQLHAATLVIRSLQAIFTASDEITPTEFQRAFEILAPDRVIPGLQAIAYSRLVKDDSDQDSPEEDPVYRVEMVAPLVGNEAVLTLDVRDQPDNLRAIRRSRDGDQPVLSEPIPLIQFAGDPEPVLGMVLRLPVYSPGPTPNSLRERRLRFVGTLAASFRLDRLLSEAIAAYVPADLDVRLEDISTAEPVLLFHKAVPGTAASDPAVGPVFERAMQLATRTWRMHATAAPAPPSTTVWLLLLLGAAGSLLLALWLRTVLGGRERALGLAERLASEQQQIAGTFRVLNELLPSLVLLVRRRDGQLIGANRSARRRIGLDAAVIDSGRGPSLADALADADLAGRLLALDSPDRTSAGELSARLKAAGGDDRWLALSSAAVDMADEPCVLIVANDITELRELNERLLYQANHDALTGLINRYSFERHFDQLIADANAGQRTGALLYIDLDQFKVINDTCSHYAGDQLLAELGSRLRASIKPGDVLARLGGDEFGVLLYDVDGERAMQVAERARQAIDGFVFAWEQRTFAVSASIGVVVIDGPGVNRRELLGHADTACYIAKDRGRNRCHLHSVGDHEVAQRKTEMEWANRIRQALAEQRLVLHYQELARLKTGRQAEGAHFELLVRLIDENGEEVPPGAFIPAAERFGLMPAIDRWVVDTALSNFSRMHPAGAEAGLCAINLSGATVDDPNFAEHVLDLLDRHAIPAHTLCFEITETVAIGNVARVIRFMQRLRLRGVRFSLDDFGSGMASFGYLKTLPVDILKIDGSFIRDIESDPADYSIVRAVTDIGHQLGLVVVAEWVGSVRTAELLRGIGVDYGQGFALHVPERVPLHRA